MPNDRRQAVCRRCPSDLGLLEVAPRLGKTMCHGSDLRADQRGPHGLRVDAGEVTGQGLEAVERTQVAEKLRGRLDPFERTGLPSGDKGSLSFYNWFVYEFWRFVFVQQEVGKLAQTALEFPPMQKGASFNLEAVKQQIEKAMQSHAGK